MTEPNCTTCQHFHTIHNVCRELEGCLLCPVCSIAFRVNLGEGKRAKPFNCPTCGTRGTDKAIEDVSNGRPACCPGWIQRPYIEPRPQQRTMFD